MHTGQHKNACIIDCTYLWNLGLINNLKMKNVNKSEIKSTYSKLQKNKKLQSLFYVYPVSTYCCLLLVFN